MTFYDFCHELSKFSMTLGFKGILDLTQYNRKNLVSTKMRAICTV